MCSRCGLLRLQNCLSSQRSLVSGALAMGDIGLDLGTLDTWIDKVSSCTPLTEAEVATLCDKVRRGVVAAGQNGHPS
ncbi:hypothetical protein EON67_05600 [archaeon]|nr:MAG: hypothetical protein EON67_05600 [archaeon]